MTQFFAIKPLLIVALYIHQLIYIAGPFFGSHFLMGGERYEVGKPEAFLFGENSDLDFLEGKPAQVMFFLNYISSLCSFFLKLWIS